MMKRIIIALSIICMVLLTACKEESNPVVQASDYVSENEEFAESLGNMQEDRLSDAENVLNDIQ